MERSAIAKRLWTLSYPTMISFAMQSVYDIVDMIWVGEISSTAVAGVTVFTTIFWLFEFLNEVVGAGSVSLISQNHGRKDLERTRLVAEQTLSFKVVMALISACALWLTVEPFVAFYTDDPEVMAAALDYGKLRILFLPLMFSSYSVNTIFRCTGDSKTPMAIMLFATCLNIILDPIFMFDTVPYLEIPGFGLGVYGAAVATVIATTCSFLIGIFLLFRKDREIYITLKGLFTLHPDIDRELFFIGLPNGFQMLLRFLFSAVMMAFVAEYGVNAISAYGIGTKVYGFAFLPINGMMMGGSILVGNFLGREEVENAEEACRISSVFNFLFMLVFSIVSILFGEEITAFFVEEPEVINLGGKILILGTLGLPLLGIGFGKAVAFMGSGYNTPLLLGGIVAQWFVQLPLMFLVTKLGLGAEFIFLTYLFADSTEFLYFRHVYRKGKWKEVRVK